MKGAKWGKTASINLNFPPILLKRFNRYNTQCKIRNTYISLKKKKKEISVESVRVDQVQEFSRPNKRSKLGQPTCG
jgi:hypothetical protein